MPDTCSAELQPLISREQAENAFRDALRLFVGRGRRTSVEQLAKGIGYKAKAIYDFTSYPPGHPDHRSLHMGIQASITAYLGADFTNEWLRLAGQMAIDLPDGPLDHERLAADAQEYLAAKMAAHRENSECGPAIGPGEDRVLTSLAPKLARVA